MSPGDAGPRVPSGGIPGAGLPSAPAPILLLLLGGVLALTLFGLRSLSELWVPDAADPGARGAGRSGPVP